MIYDPDVTEHEGSFGTAHRLQIDPTIRNASESVAYYLITAPAFHPLWSQYLLSMIRLRELPGMPPPIRKFDGATHELMVIAVNPEPGRWTVDRVVAARFSVPYLLPPNIGEQYQGTDEEMAHLADLCAQGVVHGALNPETGDAPTRIRAQWLMATTKTLAHIRGEVHAP